MLRIALRVRLRAAPFAQDDTKANELPLARIALTRMNWPAANALRPAQSGCRFAALWRFRYVRTFLLCLAVGTADRALPAQSPTRSAGAPFAQRGLASAKPSTTFSLFALFQSLPCVKGGAERM